MEFNYISGNPALASEWERLFTHLTIAMKITSSFTDIDLFGLMEDCEFTDKMLLICQQRPEFELGWNGKNSYIGVQVIYGEEHRYFMFLKIGPADSV